MSTSLSEIEPRWLKLKEAIHYSSIGKMRLKSLAKKAKKA
jgi:hypothetical protein